MQKGRGSAQNPGEFRHTQTQRVSALGRAAGSALRVYDLLRAHVVLSVPRAVRELGLTWPAVNSAPGRLEQLGIVREATGRSRDRIYVYQRQLDLLNA